MLPAALAAATLLLPAFSLAATAPSDSASLLDRIQRHISEGLAQHRASEVAAQRPSALASRPATLPAAHASAPASAAAPAPESSPADTSADGIWSALLAGNQRFAAGKPRAHASPRLADAGPPLAVLLACADAGAGEEAVFDAPARLFVVRTSGNIVDPVALGSIELAVTRQGARVLVVLGHAGCDAVRAAASTETPASACQQAIADRIRPVTQRLAGCFEGEELIERSVVANTRQSADDVLANSALLRSAAASGRLKVICAVYDRASGVVTPVTAPAATAQAQAPAR
jgi:carbonic anhydrase